MVGEECILSLNFDYKNLEEYEIEEADFENFESILIEDEESKDETGTWHVRQKYKMIPNKSGLLKLKPLKIHIEMIEEQYQQRYNKNKYLKKFNLFSQPITMNIKPLPQNITITGDYQLYAHIDKNSTLKGNPIHFSISLKGMGNIENLDFLSLNIPNTTIYEKTKEPYKKSFDILSNQSFTIPPIILRYYNQKTKQITLLSTLAFDINVIEGKNKKHPFQKNIWISFTLLLLIELLWFSSLLFETNEEQALKKQLKRCKNKEELLKKLMPYLYKDRQLMRLIYELEEIEEKKFKTLKKEILKYF